MGHLRSSYQRHGSADLPLVSPTELAVLHVPVLTELHLVDEGLRHQAAVCPAVARHESEHLQHVAPSDGGPAQ